MRRDEAYLPEMRQRWTHVSWIPPKGTKGVFFKETPCERGASGSNECDILSNARLERDHTTYGGA